MKCTGKYQDKISDSELVAEYGINGSHIPYWAMTISQWIEHDDITTQDFVKLDILKTII